MYFIDVQGTLISDKDKSPIDGAIDFIKKLKSKNIPFLLITNNTKSKSQVFFKFLRDNGFEIEKENYIDPLMVLNEVVLDKKVAAYGSNEFINNLKDTGYLLDFKKPNSVLVAIKKDFFPDEYAQMIELVLNGAKLIGMHETSIYAKNGRKYPGVGAILKMISFATQKNYDIVGKPSEIFFTRALNLLRAQKSDANFKDITIISDDVVGDLVGAKKLGMKTIFVTSGKYPNPHLIVPNLEVKPDIILGSVKELLEKI